MEEDTESVIMTRPIFDIFSVSIHPSETRDCPNPFSDGKLCHIYGSVKVCDEYENVYHLYNRKEDNPDIIRMDGHITLTGFPVICSKSLSILVYIYDMSHQAEISNGTFVLDYNTEYSYNKPLSSEVKGQYGFADIHHATFLHAVVVDVKKVSFKKENGGSGDLFGSVVACLERAGGEEYASTILFDNGLKDQECKSVPAKFNTPLQLFRSCVAVPVFCTLTIKLDFDDKNGCRINKNIVKHGYSWDLFEESVPDQNYAIRVQVQWPYCYEKFPSAREMKDQVDAKQVFTQDLKFINIKSQLSSEAEEGITRFRSQYRRPYFDVSSFVEVFSVLVFFDDNDIDIDGTVKLVDSSGESLHIFKGSDKLSTERRTLAIQCPPSMFEISDEKPFKMVVSLKSGENRVVGEGTHLWHDMNIRVFFDKHLCSIFKGDNAYTAVHYSMFKRSAQASIVASFIGKCIPQVPETEVRVCGSITAEYGSYEYSTPYDQENYKSRLFSRSEDDCSRFHLGSNLELSKYLLAFPLEDTLVFNVNLKVGLGVDQEFEVLKQVVEFKPYISNICALEKSSYTFFMLVEWSDVSDPKPFTYPNFSDMRSLQKLMPKLDLKV